MSPLTEDMYELLEKPTKAMSNDKYLLKQVMKYFKPIFQKKSYKRNKKRRARQASY